MSKAQIYKSETAPITNTLIAKLMVIRDVRTRWNYTHAMKTGSNLAQGII